MTMPLPIQRAKARPSSGKRQRFELLDHGSIIASSGCRPARLPHLTDLEDDILMSTTWVKLRCRQSGVEFAYLNTHLNDASEGARLAGNEHNVQQLAALDANGALPVIWRVPTSC